METFTAVILLLLVVGVVACACAFPYRAVLERKADQRRWEVSLARWTLEEDFPVYEPIARFAARPSAEGLAVYLPEERPIVAPGASPPSGDEGDAETFPFPERDAPAPADA
jgi:hypothetical protein